MQHSKYVTVLFAERFGPQGSFFVNPADLEHAPVIVGIPLRSCRFEKKMKWHGDRC